MGFTTTSSDSYINFHKVIYNVWKFNNKEKKCNSYSNETVNKLSETTFMQLFESKKQYTF